MVLLVVLELEQKISRPRFIVFFAALLSFEFLTSTELFATTTLVGVSAIVLALLDFTAGPQTCCVAQSDSYFLCISRQSWFADPISLFHLHERRAFAINSAAQYSTDLLNFVLPTRVTLIGGTQFRHIQ